MSVLFKKDGQDDTKDIIPGKQASSSINSNSIIPNSTASTREVAMVILGLVLFVIVMSLAIALGTMPSKSKVLSDVCTSPTCLKGSGYVMANLNQSVDPCDNFYEYACGAWRERNDLNPGESYRTVYSKMLAQNQNKLKSILSRSSVVKYGSADYKIKLFFRTCINEYQNEKKGGQPLIDVLRNATGTIYLFDKDAKGKFDWQKSLQKVHVDYWTDALFSFRVGQNYNEPKKRIIQVDLGGLGMRWWYYTSTNSPRYEEIRTSYKNFMRNVTALFLRDSGLKLTEAETKSRIEEFVSDVMHIEMGLANITATTPPSQNPHEYENLVALGDLSKNTGWDWTAFFQYMFNQNPITPSTKIVLLEKEYLYKVSDFIRITALEDVFDNLEFKKMNQYFVWRLMQTYLPDLSYEYNHLGRQFYVEMTGNTQFQGTYQYCFNYAAAKMSDALGALFVKDHFADQSKPKVHEMVAQLKQTMIDRLPNLSWMDPATRDAAKQKIQNIVDKIGHPDFMLDEYKLDQIYSTLKITRDYFQNVLNINKFEQADLNRRLGEGVNKDEWRLNTYDVAAKFSQLWMELIVPAGIMQIPIFHQDIPMYMNFGSIGNILSHELIHAIDEYGGFFNKEGNFEDWWSTKTETAYISRRQCLVDFYNTKTYNIYGQTFKVNGLRYSRDGIAEIGGLRQAYYAYRDWVEKNGVEKLSPTLHLNNEQAFFVSYAQTNCFVRSEYSKWLQSYRGSVPEDIRTNSAIEQLAEFQRVFKCKSGQKMNPPDRCSVF